MKKVSIILLVLVSASSCISNSHWNDKTNWYYGERPIRDSLVDVLYFVSTNVMNSYDKNGKETYTAVLNDAEKGEITNEMRYADRMFGNSFNFISPYYHSFTGSAINLPADSFKRNFGIVSGDARAAYRYYMKHINGGRRFIIAGFSQGAMMCLEILKNEIDEDEFERLVAAYLIGYRITSEDIGCQYVKPADGADGTGVTISFNSVADTSSIWPLVTEGAATCINPVNWRTDGEPARFAFRSDTLAVRVDTSANVLTVSGPGISDYNYAPLESFCKKGNLHHWDILFYGDAIRSNAQRRAYPAK